jgi:hypothetical protein
MEFSGKVKPISAMRDKYAEGPRFAQLVLREFIAPGTQSTSPAICFNPESLSAAETVVGRNRAEKRVNLATNKNSFFIIFGDNYTM